MTIFFSSFGNKTTGPVISKPTVKSSSFSNTMSSMMVTLAHDLKPISLPAGNTSTVSAGGSKSSTVIIIIKANNIITIIIIYIVVKVLNCNLGQGHYTSIVIDIASL